jgi:membrane protein DedA with SNARE-associated domain
MLLIAAGAFVRQGIMDWQTTFLVAWLGALLTDAASYAMGRRAGRWARGRVGERYAEVWHQAEEMFRSHGGWAVFATSWLVRGLASPTNLIAGSSRYPFGRFVAWHAAGKLLWILLHAGLGYASAGQWRLIADTVSRYGAWMGACAAVVLVAYLLVRRLRAKQERPASKSPAASG